MKINTYGSWKQILARPKLLAVASVLGIVLAACGSGSSSNASATSSTSAHGNSTSSNATNAHTTKLIVSYFTNGFYSGVVASSKALTNSIPAQVKFVQVQSGPATLAGMKSGAFDMTTQTGNPPITGAIALNTPVQVIWAEAYDNAGLVVNNSIKTPAEMAGKKFGDLVGSSEDFSFESWLKVNHLLGKVTLVNLDRAGMVAAMKTGAIAGGYNDAPYTNQMAAEGGHLVVTSKQIAAMGFPSINMLTVDTQFAQAHPNIVQAYVCADAKAYSLMTGSNKKSVIAKAASFLGLPAASGLSAGLSYPLFSPSQELTSAALGKPGSVQNGAVAKALYLTGSFLKTQGLLKSPPSMNTILQHINLKFAQGVQNGACK